MLIQTAELPPPPPINSIYSYPELERITRDDGVRHYQSPDGLLLPSVTTVLSETADNEGLKQWREWVGEKKANEMRDEGAALGNLLHEHMERYIDGGERPKGNNLIRAMSRRMADVIINRGLTHVDEIWGYEVPLYFPELYAGTTDLVGVYNGRPAIMDYKNAKKMKKKEMIPDYFCQGVAYALAHNFHFDTDISQVVIFMVSRDLQYTPFIIEGEEFDYWGAEWQRRLIEYETRASNNALSR